VFGDIKKIVASHDADKFKDEKLVLKPLDTIDSHRKLITNDNEFDDIDIAFE
jgi:hypothetical protein